MSVKKLSLASLILFGITACSSGGGSSDVITDKPQNNSVQTELDTTKSELATSTSDLQKAQAELAKLKSDKNATSEQLTQAKINLENAEKAKGLAESKLATMNNEKQAVQNQLNSVNAELAKARNELQKSKEVAESKLTTINNEKQAVQNQLNSANTELAKAKNELQKAEANFAQTQADKNSTAEQLATAKQEKEAAELALKNKTALIKEIVQKAAEITNEQGREYSWVNYTGLSSLPQGLSKHAFISMSAENLDGIFVGNHYIYLTPSVTVVGYDISAFWNEDTTEQRRFRVNRIEGVRTTNLPTSGEVTYVGKAFNSDNVGTLNYKVNFTEKTGGGSLSQFNNTAIPTIQLEKGNIVDGMIKANASASGGISGKYELGFYGENAQAIAGETYLYKQFEGGITTNKTTAEKYGDSERGTVFGVAGEKQ
ncbi:factor H binding protein domain-containing protein [Mannheimia sp. USDA-ARS-USMARC-1261]|uniref:factor H binding protein domain-containing protein n=1 Tax=Mannheimia sp. USDA-ARS-USMARC-1261 TaxID=1432056 RepID=UPI00046C99C1|nr:factor H binding protein domain-containing protein [Mannheimia sp. USDA-ARS-USMARC-1261]